jgi:hypothetical protein
VSVQHLLAPIRLLVAVATSVVLLATVPGFTAAASPASARAALVAARMEMTVVQSAGHGHGGGGGGGSGTPTGYDISYPQCGKPYPTNVLFGIVGVNDGIVYSPNPCLSSQILWAETSQAGQAQFYANTADPGPTFSSYWPASGSAENGQTCVYPDKTSPDANSDGCNYLYGWYAAEDSYNTAVAAYNQLNGTPQATTTPYAATWWLDVETANSWQTDTSRNMLALRGAADYLTRVAGAPSVGIYSTASMWQTITGGDTVTFPRNPNWLPGARSEKAAQSNCSGTGFTGGQIVLTQYLSGGFDADYLCPAP